MSTVLFESIMCLLSYKGILENTVKKNTRVQKLYSFQYLPPQAQKNKHWSVSSVPLALQMKLGALKFNLTASEHRVSKNKVASGRVAQPVTKLACVACCPSVVLIISILSTTTSQENTASREQPQASQGKGSTRSSTQKQGNCQTLSSI